jgi:hypothetical protein
MKHTSHVWVTIFKKATTIRHLPEYPFKTWKTRKEAQEHKQPHETVRKALITIEVLGFKEDYTTGGKR